MTAVTGELGELASLLKMRNRERDGLPGNKFSPSDKQIADELADVLTYLDLLAAALGVDLGRAAAEKFNEVSERVGFPDRLAIRAHDARPANPAADEWNEWTDCPLCRRKPCVCGQPAAYTKQPNYGAAPSSQGRQSSPPVDDSAVAAPPSTKQPNYGAGGDGQS